MVAPVNAIAKLSIGDDQFTLTFNFAVMEAIEDAGVNLEDDEVMAKPTKIARLLHATLIPKHEELTVEQTFSMIMGNVEAVQIALGELFEKARAKPSGNSPGPKRKRKARAAKS